MTTHEHDAVNNITVCGTPLGHTFSRHLHRVPHDKPPFYPFSVHPDNSIASIDVNTLQIEQWNT